MGGREGGKGGGRGGRREGGIHQCIDTLSLAMVFAGRNLFLYHPLFNGVITLLRQAR